MGGRSLCSILIAFFHPFSVVDWLNSDFNAPPVREKNSFSPRHSFGEYFAGEVKQTFDDLTTLVVWKEHIVRVIAHKLIAERRKRFEATRVEKKRKKRKSKP